MPVRGLRDPVEVYELTGRRPAVAPAGGHSAWPHSFRGAAARAGGLQQALEQASAGHGQVVALVGEAGVGKSRLVYECVHSHRTQGWRVLESASVSYGRRRPTSPLWTCSSATATSTTATSLARCGPR